METKGQGLPVSEILETKTVATRDSFTKDSALNTVTPLEKLEQIAAGFQEKKASCDTTIPLCLPGYERPLQPYAKPFTAKNQLFKDLARMRDAKLLLLFNGKPLSADSLKELQNLTEAMDAHPSVIKIQLESKLLGIQVRLKKLAEKKQVTTKDLLEQSAQLLEHIKKIDRMNSPSLEKFITDNIEQSKYIFAELKEKLTPPGTEYAPNATQLTKLLFAWHNQQIMSVSGVVLQTYADLFDQDKKGMPVIQDLCITNIEAGPDSLTFTAVAEKFSYIILQGSKPITREILIDPTITARFHITSETTSALPTVSTNKIELVKHLFITFCENRCRDLEKEKPVTKEPGDKKSRTSLMATPSLSFFKPSHNLSKREQLNAFLYTVYLKMLTAMPLEDDSVFKQHMEAMAKLPVNDASVDLYLATQYVKKHSKATLSLLLKRYAKCIPHNGLIKAHSKASAIILDELKQQPAKENLESLSGKFSKIQKQYAVTKNELFKILAEISKIKQNNFKNLENFSIESLFELNNDLNECEESSGLVVEEIPLLDKEIVEFYKEIIMIRDGISESKPFVPFR